MIEEYDEVAGSRSLENLYYYEIEYNEVLKEGTC